MAKSNRKKTTARKTTARKTTATRKTTRQPKTTAARQPSGVTKAQQTAAQKDPASVDLGRHEVAERVEREQEQGFAGRDVDPTPNENYTVDGVTSGKPTPETDPKQAAKARAAARGEDTA